MSAPTFTQIDYPQWPSGYPTVIAITRVRTELLARAFGLRFSPGFDNLDNNEAAAIRMRSGRILGLLRHTGNHNTGTELHADAGDNFVSALREFLDAFDLSTQDLSWMRPDMRAAVKQPDRPAPA